MNTYKNLKDIQEQRPQLVKRLINWGLRRKNKWGFQTIAELEKQQDKVKTEIELYLDDLVFTPSDFKQAKDKLIYWGGKLTHEEKQAIGLLIPYGLPLTKHCTDRTGDNVLSDRWYDGLYKVLDEPVLDKICYKSEELGLVTENSYGAVILNTDTMMIIDIDLDNDGCTLAKYPEQVMSALSILEEKEKLSFRVYKTAGGLRAIETTKLWKPNDYSTKKLMKSVYADPLYVGLCWSQECFRARLTPKPWRLWHYSDGYDFVNGEKWISDNAEDSEVAVCQLLSGDKPIDDKFKSVIEYHDKVTKALISEEKDLGLV